MPDTNDLPPLFSVDDEFDEDDRTVVAQVAAPQQLASTGQRAYLIVLAGPNVGAVFRLRDRQTHIGRSPKCEIPINDTGISRKHVKLTLLNDTEILLEDLKSTNGTFVENDRVTSMVLKDGARFQLGGTTLVKFSVSDEVEERFQRQLYESSVQDGLTGLHNRKHFDERLASEFGFAMRHGAMLTLIMIDIDHFKKVNDTYGHQVGDQVLRAVAQALARNIRTEDLVARFGGEEFAVIARGLSAEQGRLFANRVRGLIEKLRIRSNGHTISLTISAGVATRVDDLFKTDAELVAAADQALYAAKETGRNKVVVAEECRVKPPPIPKS